jgi:hypothetical protein
MDVVDLIEVILLKVIIFTLNVLNGYCFYAGVSSETRSAGDCKVADSYTIFFFP